MLYTLEEVARATGGVLHNADPATAVEAVSIDSRDVPDGALFVAIAGDRFDGHDFVAGAIAAGAVAALVATDRVAGLAPGLPTIAVGDPLVALGDLGRFARQRNRGSIVAVTGSAGKTSTKEALRAIFAAAGSTHASIKSFNNHWGVPLTLSRLPADAAFGVFEIGMNHAGEITPLVKMVRPHVAVITSIGEAHLEHLGSVEAIADAKGEIFAGVAPGGVAIVNADHAHMGRLARLAGAAGVTLVSYGVAEDARYRVLESQPRPGQIGASGRLVGPDLDLELVLATPGLHTLVNAAGAVLAARAAGVDPRDAAQTLATHHAGAGRGEMVTLGEPDAPIVLIDESYNANPSSMRAALAVFAGLPATGRKVLVLGDMRELGADARALHEALAGPVQDSDAEAVFLVGVQMAHLAEVLPDGLVRRHCRSVEELLDPVLDSLASGDVVMVKGSNGERLGALVEAMKKRLGAPQHG